MHDKNSDSFDDKFAKQFTQKLIQQKTFRDYVF